MRLAGAVTRGSGAINEDGLGHIETDGSIAAAWIFDGVTGINDRNYLPGGSDAAWLVTRADAHLRDLALTVPDLVTVLDHLVERLIGDWAEASSRLDLPADYDPPAACLIIARRDAAGWTALRLGDSCLLARGRDGGHQLFAASPNNTFDHWLAAEARKRRDDGLLDVKALLAEFRPQLLASRARRNTADGYSVLEANRRATLMPELITLGWPQQILLCTDGFYRAVDHYALYDDADLLSACSDTGGVDRVLSRIRGIEADDPLCQHYIRFKPGDDATALMLSV